MQYLFNKKMQRIMYTYLCTFVLISFSVHDIPIFDAIKKAQRILCAFVFISFSVSFRQPS